MNDTAIIVGALFPDLGFDPAATIAAFDTPTDLYVHYQYGQERQPQGFPRVYNELLSFAFRSHDWVWVLGDDVKLMPGSLNRSQTLLRNDPSIGAIFPVEAWVEDSATVTILPFDGRKVGIEDALSPDPIEQIFPGMACAGLSKKAWDAVGPLDETLGLGYAEDLDWGIRCWRAHFRVVNYRNDWYLHRRGATYNRLVASGIMDETAPSEAAAKCQTKWPFLWREDGPTIMKRLKGEL